MKKTIFSAIFTLFFFGCGASPKPFEIKDVCAQPEGTEAILQGYLFCRKRLTPFN